jgi:LPXTG-motif cell wall-anchored protein
MKKALAVLTGTMAFVMTFAGAALAQTTEAPGGVVQGGGGGGAGETAFTGSDASTAVMIALALVVVGLVALFLARRRATARS